MTFLISRYARNNYSLVLKKPSTLHINRVSFKTINYKPEFLQSQKRSDKLTGGGGGVGGEGIALPFIAFRSTNNLGAIKLHTLYINPLPRNRYRH